MGGPLYIVKTMRKTGKATTLVCTERIRGSEEQARETYRKRVESLRKMSSTMEKEVKENEEITRFMNYDTGKVIAEVTIKKKR